MPREKEHFRDVVEIITERTGKTMLGVVDIMQYLNVGYNKAQKYLNGAKTVTVFQFARQLL